MGAVHVALGVWLPHPARRYQLLIENRTNAESGDAAPLDCSQLTEWELGVLFSDSPSAALSPPDGPWVHIAQARSGRTVLAGPCEPISARRLPTPALGERFGRLVVERAVKRDDGRTWLLCNCDCGGSTLAKASHLRRGEVVSCGCKRREDAVGKLQLSLLGEEPITT